MSADSPVSFGDNVRVVATPETEAAGLAGRSGQVYGETTPSSTGVDVIGELASDFAINVYFDDLSQGFWLAPQLLEFIDHAPGTEMQLDGSPVKSVRQPDGSWVEVPVQPRRSGWLVRLLRRLSGRT